MANMTYCRYRNTLSALRDCASDLEDRIYAPPPEDEDGEEVELPSLSREERDAALKLIDECLNIVALITDYTGIDDLDMLMNTPLSSRLKGFK